MQNKNERGAELAARWAEQLGAPLGLGPLALEEAGPGEGWALETAGERILTEKTDLLGRRHQTRETRFFLRLRLAQPEGDGESIRKNCELLLELWRALDAAPPPPGFDQIFVSGKYQKAVSEEGILQVKTGLLARYTILIDP